MKAKEVEWEVLPPEEKGHRASVEPLFRWLALIMDDFLRFPGTKFRFGLDPIIGVPRILLARMAMNILINELVGIIPGLGDAFSFWFKSNVRNYELVRRYTAAPEQSRRGDWIFLIAVLGLLFVIVCAGLIASFLMLQAIGRFVFQR